MRPGFPYSGRGGGGRTVGGAGVGGGGRGDKLYEFVFTVADKILPSENI